MFPGFELAPSLRKSTLTHTPNEIVDDLCQKSDLTRAGYPEMCH
jgi:hypothetical protein